MKEGKGVSNLKGRTSRKLMIFKRVNRLRRKIGINTQKIAKKLSTAFRRSSI